MQQHPADCLRGPVRRSRGPWTGPPEPFPEAGQVEKGVPQPGDPDIRWDLVERIRKEIAEGTYDTEEKLEKALERLWENME